MSTQDNAMSGILETVIPIGRVSVRSAAIMVAGAKWHFNFGEYTSSLSVTPPSESWKATTAFSLLARSNASKDWTRLFQGTQEFSSRTLIAHSKGYMPTSTADNPLTLRWEIIVTKLSGYRIPTRCTFESSADAGSVQNLVLVVGAEKKRLHASRELLASVSPVFERMLMGQFKESQQNEISLEDENADEFTEFLHGIYHRSTTINKSNIDGLTRLADYFAVELLTELYEQWYIRNQEHFTKIELLMVADRHKYSTLLAAVLEKLTHQEVETMITGFDFHTLSLDTRAVVLETKFHAK